LDRGGFLLEALYLVGDDAIGVARPRRQDARLHGVDELASVRDSEPQIGLALEALPDPLPERGLDPVYAATNTAAATILAVSLNVIAKTTTPPPRTFHGLGRRRRPRTADLRRGCSRCLPGLSIALDDRTARPSANVT
jgi:hypothetical protein